MSPVPAEALSTMRPPNVPTSSAGKTGSKTGSVTSSRDARLKVGNRVAPNPGQRKRQKGGQNGSNSKQEISSETANRAHLANRAREGPAVREAHAPAVEGVEKRHAGGKERRQAERGVPRDGARRGAGCEEQQRDLRGGVEA